MAVKTSYELASHVVLLQPGFATYQLNQADPNGAFDVARALRVKVLAEFTAPGLVNGGPLFALLKTVQGFEPLYLNVPYDLRAAASARLRQDVSGADESGDIVASACTLIDLPHVYESGSSLSVEVHNYCPASQANLTIFVDLVD